MLGGCSEQTVRNLLLDNKLQGEQQPRGQRSTRWRVDVPSVHRYLALHGSPARHRDVDRGRLLQDLDQRLRRIEERPQFEENHLDPVNLQFAVLRLMQIQEKYQSAVNLLMAADEQKSKANSILRSISNEYRAIIEQQILPSSPPQI